MALKKLLLPLTGTQSQDAALTVALIAARSWHAHLTALHVRGTSGDLVAMAGEGLSGTLIEQMITATEQESGRRADSARAVFDRFVAHHHVALTPARPGATEATASFETASGREDEVIARLARVADVTVLPRPDPDQDVTTSDALHAVLFDSGRPVLICPRVAPPDLGTRVCLAWSGAAEAAAAARFGIPWMQRATEVTILTAPSYTRRGPSAEALAGYLALHDITTRHRACAAADQAAGPALLAAARAEGADLLIMGAYSSSRLRQMILGGTTRHILENADLPVLMCR